MTLRTLSLPVKVLFTSFLVTVGIGYLFALVYLFLIDVEPHTRHGAGLVQAVILKYYGDRGSTPLEAALEGKMGGNLPPPQKAEIVRWLREGAKEVDFSAIRPIFQNQCAGCHSKGSGLPIPPLTTFEEVKAYVQADMGQSVKALVRVSHVHLFGISFIFLLTGGIFALGETDPRRRALVVAVPFLAIWLDIGSWWFTRFRPVFAYTVIIGGALMGLSLGAQIAIPLWEMWLRTKTKNNGNIPGGEK